MSKYIYFSAFTFLFTLYTFHKRKVFYKCAPPSHREELDSEKKLKIFDGNDKKDYCWCCEINKLSCSKCGKRII